MEPKKKNLSRFCSNFCRLLPTSVNRDRKVDPMISTAIASFSTEKNVQTKFKNKKKSYTSYTKLAEVKLLTIGIASPLRILQWAEKTLPNGKIYGEVLNANTLHHKTFKPQKGGLFCERIFGPLKDFECACGKINKGVKQELSNSLLKRKIELNEGNNSSPSSVISNQSLSPNKSLGNLERVIPTDEKKSNTQKNTKQLRKFCAECDVEYTWSVIRRYQLGYIKLISPVTHIWFLKGSPSYLSILLDIKKRHLQYITYCSQTLTLENSIAFFSTLPNSTLYDLNFDTPSTIFTSWQKIVNSKSKELEKQSETIDKQKTKKETKRFQLVPTPKKVWKKTLQSLLTEIAPGIEGEERPQHFDRPAIVRGLEQRKEEDSKNFKNQDEIFFLKRFLLTFNQLKLASIYTMLGPNFILSRSFLPFKKEGGGAGKKRMEVKNILKMTQKKLLVIALFKKLQKSLPINLYIFWLTEQNLQKNLLISAIEKSWSILYQQSYKQALKKASFLSFMTFKKVLSFTFVNNNNQFHKLNKTQSVLSMKLLMTLWTQKMFTLKKIIHEIPDLLDVVKQSYRIQILSKIKTCKILSFSLVPLPLAFYFPTAFLHFSPRVSKSPEPSLISYEKLTINLASYFLYKTDLVEKLLTKLFLKPLLIGYFFEKIANDFYNEKTIDYQSKTQNLMNTLNPKVYVFYEPFVKYSKTDKLFKLLTLSKNSILNKHYQFSFVNNFLDIYTVFNAIENPAFKSSKSLCLFPETLSPFLLKRGKGKKGGPETRDKGKEGVNKKEKGLFQKAAKQRPIYQQLKLFNNIYTLSHRERWDNDKDWQVFVLYNSARPDYNDLPIFAYQKRILTNTYSPSQGLAATQGYTIAFPFSSNSGRGEGKTNNHAISNRFSSALFSGPGLVKQLVDEFSFYSNSYFSSVSSTRPSQSSSQLLTFSSDFSGPFSFPPRDGVTGGTGETEGAGKILGKEPQREIQKLDKQNRLILYQLNKMIFKLKRHVKIFIYDKDSQKLLKELCKNRDLLIRRTKVVRKIFRKDSNPSNMILTILPVLPPDLRPIVKMGDQIAASDLNRLYQRVIYRNERLKKFLKDPATSHSYEMKYAQRLLQEAVDNLIQNGKSGMNSEKDSRGRALKSLSDNLKGKQGRFRQFLLGKRVDYSGRSVIVVGPSLKLHECGIPIEMAKELYLPFLLKAILNKNYARTVIGAKALIQNSPFLATELLREILQVSPLLLNRAPTLHRLGIQAFIPKLVEGRAILLHPLVCSAFNADFDGDQMAVHVPITIEARAEAWKLMSSRNNILAPATGDPLAIPSQDMVLGCYYLTTFANKGSLSRLSQLAAGFRFNNFKDVLKAYHQNKVSIHSPVWVKWTGVLQNGNDQEEPLEIRVSQDGICQEILANSHNLYDSSNLLLNQYIVTTPGRILFNFVISKGLNKML